MNQRYLIAILATLVLTNTSQAKNLTQISRYATVANKASLAQINPLQAIQQTHFPVAIQTIGDAIQHWLQYSGFHLACENKQPNSLKLILKQPLPQIDRTLGPISIANGLTVLVGQKYFALQVNHLSREVNFKLITGKKI